MLFVVYGKYQLLYNSILLFLNCKSKNDIVVFGVLSLLYTIIIVSYAYQLVLAIIFVKYV